MNYSSISYATRRFRALIISNELLSIILTYNFFGKLSFMPTCMIMKQRVSYYHVKSQAEIEFNFISFYLKYVTTQKSHKNSALRPP